MRSYFNPTVFDGGGVPGRDSAGFDGGYDGTVCDVGGGEAVEDQVGGAGAVGGKVDDGVGFNEACVLKGGFDDQHAVADEDIFVGRGGLLKLPVAEAAHFGFFEPGRGRHATTREVFVKNGTIDMADDGAEAVVNEETGDGEAEEEANERDDGYPFFAGVFLVNPRFFDFALLHAPGVEVSLW